jgi:hypothetical protein
MAKTCRVGTPQQSLAGWCKENNHPLGSHHALEKFLTHPDNVERLVLELCCPILA